MVYPTTPKVDTRRASRVAQRYARLHFPETMQVRRWAVAGLFLMVAAVALFVVDPVDLLITWQTTLKPGTVAYKVWEHPPDALFIRVYVFNVTNPDDFLRGKEKLIIQQVGPFVFREVTSFDNLTMNENGTATFHPHRHLEFVRESSVGYPGDFTINAFNLPLLGAAALLSDRMLVTNVAFRSIAMIVGAKPFVRLSVDQLFWGYDDPLVTMAHSIAPFFVDFQRLGLLDRMYAKEDVVTIFTGRNAGGDTSTDVVTKGVYSIDTYNGEGGFPFWGHGMKRSDPDSGLAMAPELSCDTLRGSFEGLLFPRHVGAGQRIYVYRQQFCRVVPLDHVGMGRSPEGYEYMLYNAYAPALTESNDTENICHCTSSAGIPGGCMPTGFSAASPCYYHLPVALSLPHMLYADKKISSLIGGQSPNHDEHMSFIKLQPDLGIPLEIRCRLQLNLMMGKTRLSITQPFDNMALPILWIDMEMSDLPDFVKFLMWLALRVGPIAQGVAVALCATGGLAMMVRAFLLRRRAASRQQQQRSASRKISHISALQ